MLERQHAEAQLEQAIQNFSTAIQNSHQREHLSNQATLQTDLNIAQQKENHQLALDELARLKILEKKLLQELIVLEKTCEEPNTSETFDFLHSFLDQTVDQATGITYDSRIPFEDRPAVSLPNKSQTSKGHIAWGVSKKTEKEGHHMTRDDLEQRIRTELDLPYFKAQIDAERDYTEDDYQEFKRDLVNYYKTYVQDIDTDFQGGLD